MWSGRPPRRIPIVNAPLVGLPFEALSLYGGRRCEMVQCIALQEVQTPANACSDNSLNQLPANTHYRHVADPFRSARERQMGCVERGKPSFSVSRVLGQLLERTPAGRILVCTTVCSAQMPRKLVLHVVAYSWPHMSRRIRIERLQGREVGS